jgi:hypothetical protein
MLKSNMPASLRLILASLAFFAGAQGSALANPPNDGEAESVHINTSWRPFPFDMAGCHVLALVSMQREGYLIEDMGETISGKRGGMTTVIRCDLQGHALVSIAYRKNPGQGIADLDMANLLKGWPVSPRDAALASK